MQAHFDFVLVLTYAFPKELLQPLLPPGLELDVFGDLGFVAVALVNTRQMRPRGFPAAVSQDYFLVGYRIFVRYQTRAGRKLRGLKILRSDTNSASMRLMGNLMTHYGFEYCDVSFDRSADVLNLQTTSSDGVSDLQLTANLSESENYLPPGSPFSSVREALKFAGPMPFTFDYEAETNSIIRVEGVREHWKPVPISVNVSRANFFRQPPFESVEPKLCSAFFVENIPYHWNAGIRETLPSPAVDEAQVNTGGGASFQRNVNNTRKPRVEGMTRVVKFNWPLYAIAGGGASALALLSLNRRLPDTLRSLCGAGAVGVASQTLASLIVSHVVYDRSPLSHWKWLSDVPPQDPLRVLNVHAGYDETRDALSEIFPNSEVSTIDFYRSLKKLEPSIVRARRLYPSSVPFITSSATEWPLASNSVDLILIAFAAHEIRQPEQRELLFAEAKRVLSNNGRFVLVEHLRDVANTLAFGPGVLHFQSEAEWRRCARGAGLNVVSFNRITPFVGVFTLCR